MALPKKRKLDINVKSVDPQGGPQRWFDQFQDQNKQLLPRTVDMTDLDSGFVEFVSKDLEIIVDGERVPTNFLTLQRWNEFTRTWQNTDKYKNLKIPFISIVRKPNPETGTNPADFKIPVRKNFPYMEMSIWDGNKKGVDIYTIPNPVGVDMLYTVRLVTYKMRELNKLHQKVLQTFASAQAYVNIKGHYFPILLESIGDESQVDDLEGKRFYVQTYEMRLQGYLVDSEEFEVRPAVSRMMVSSEIEIKSTKPVVTFIPIHGSDNIRYITQFIPGPYTESTVITDYSVVMDHINTINISSYEINVNGNNVSLPFPISEGDTITITIVKEDSNSYAELELVGPKIC